MTYGEAPSPYDLSGRVAVVTGAGTGIGQSTSIELSRQGADVVLAGRNRDNLERTAQAVRSLGRRALVQPTDVNKAPDCRALIERAVEELGQIDVLVNNAGGSRSRGLADWDEEGFDRALNLNLRGVFVLCQAAVAHMAPRGAGSIINVSSIASERAMPGIAPYGIAKAGVNNLTRTFAAEHGRSGIRVNCVCVGFIATDGLRRALHSIGRTPDEVASGSSALGRAGEADEVARTVVFLASSASSYITGEVVHVTGGPAVSGPW